MQHELGRVCKEVKRVSHRSGRNQEDKRWCELGKRCESKGWIGEHTGRVWVEEDLWGVQEVR